MSDRSKSASRPISPHSRPGPSARRSTPRLPPSSLSRQLAPLLSPCRANPCWLTASSSPGAPACANESRRPPIHCASGSPLVESSCRRPRLASADLPAYHPNDFSPDRRMAQPPLGRTTKIWRDGALVDWNDATIHVMSHVVHYGSSVFEGMRCYETPNGGAMFRAREHMRRLHDSSRIYRIPLGYSVDDLVQACSDTIAANELRECY